VKKDIGGYDGYGTFIVSVENEYLEVEERLASENTTFVAEAFVPFKRELAVTFARSREGQVVRYPIVESFQTESRCDWVKGPVRSTRHMRFLNKIQRALNTLDYVGVIAFELFETRLGELLVNEIAPRVHNSSHYSMNGFTEDQFSMHVKAVSGRQLVNPECLTGGFAMKNLIGSGQKGLSLKTKRPVHVHWYGKQENRNGRKMGHVNALASNPNAALKLAQSSVKEMKV
ncbi:MAG: ATP-grasp domain-containing protein, partial [Pseudomonadota bacterium]